MNESKSLEDLQKSLKQFGILDYIIFTVMLVGCAAIGIYYALREKNTGGDNVNEYLMGGRNMKTFPVSMSLIASMTSGITLLGVPTEIYLYGTEYSFIVITLVITGVIAASLFLPIFHEMQLCSTYAYLERRFDKNVRLLGSLLFTIAQIAWLPIVIYMPALAFNQVTGVNIHIITSCVCLICIFYTCLGGLKAVVWTDVLQTGFMILSLMIVCIKGSIDVGGFIEVMNRNYHGDRLVIPELEFDLTKRHTIWCIVIGGTFMYVQGAIISQNVLQRYLSLPTISHARQAMMIFVFGTAGLVLLCCYAGLVIYATFHDCDPLTTKLAKAKDQLLPLLVMRVLSNIPGLPGLFVAGVFSASLSTLSTGLNSMSAVVLEDFVKTFVKKELSDRMTWLLLRGTTLIFGAVFLGLVLIVEKLGTVLQLSISLGSATSGPTLGIFICGILLPWVNAKGALFGGLFGLFGTGYVIIGAQNAMGNNRLKFISKPTSVEGCIYDYNSSATLSSTLLETVDDDKVFPLFKISYFWYTAFGCLLTISMAVLLSAVTGFTNLKSLDPDCFAPIIRNKIPRTTSHMQIREEQELIAASRKDRG